jgi:hypothetical protein
VALLCVVPVPGFRKLKAAIDHYEAEHLPTVWPVLRCLSTCVFYCC